LQSQRSTYRTYISASKKVIERYDLAVNYYDKTITLKREQLDDLYVDLKSSKSNSHRADFENLAELKSRRNDLLSFSTYFRSAKGNLVDISAGFYGLRDEEDRLKSIASSDDELVLFFNKKFKFILEDFGYRSNGLSSVEIRNKGAYRLLPSVFISGQEPQYIRYVSSASDFVRSIWAYYVALLEVGVIHPGFLVMDEPGQHQMRVDSLKALLNKISRTEGQSIIAISQDRDYDQKNVNINDLLSEMDPNSYKLMHIDDGAGCIGRMG
jgi:hypothetical protein